MIKCVSFLQPWLYGCPSVSFQLVFSENSSICRCIFDVFIGGGELHAGLLHYLDVSFPEASSVSVSFSVAVILAEVEVLLPGL